MTKRFKIMSLALLVVFGGIIAFNLIKSFMIKRFFAHYKPPAVTVSSAAVKEINWHPKLHAVGNLIANEGVDLSAQTSGNVTKIDFASGQFIEKGAPLITLDDSIDQALLKFNQADLRLKTLAYQRQMDLFKKGATSSSNVDEAQANLNQAQAKVEQTEAQINQKHIVAPFSGRLGIRKVNLGQFINPGQTTIVSLQSLDPLYLEFYLPEQYYKQIQTDQPIRFSLDQFPHLVFQARVSAINSKIDTNTHNVLVQGTVANCPLEALKQPVESPFITSKPLEGQNKILVSCDTEQNINHQIKRYAFVPGMFAAVEIERQEKPHTLVVPSTAISYSLYGNAIYIIEKDNENQDQLIARRVFVTTGEQHENNTVIKKGLKAGQMVVSTGEIKLQNNTPVVINNEVQLNPNNQSDALR